MHHIDVSLDAPSALGKKLYSQEQIKRSFDLEEHNFKKIIDYYEYGYILWTN